MKIMTPKVKLLIVLALAFSTVTAGFLGAHWLVWGGLGLLAWLGFGLLMADFVVYGLKDPVEERDD